LTAAEVDRSIVLVTDTVAMVSMGCPVCGHWFAPARNAKGRDRISSDDAAEMIAEHVRSIGHQRNREEI
jgi:hypothetical protein